MKVRIAAVALCAIAFLCAANAQDLASFEKRTTVKVSTSKTVKAVALDGGIWMDANPADNKWQAQ